MQLSSVQSQVAIVIECESCDTKHQNLYSELA